MKIYKNNQIMTNRQHIYWFRFVIKLFIITVLLFVTHTNLSAQRYITGKVVEINGEPLPGASIRLDNSNNYQISDLNGEFRFSIGKHTYMSVHFIGYESVTIESIDTISQPITIVMKESPYSFGYPPPNRKDYTVSDFGFIMSLQFDILPASFNHFESILGMENVDNLNKLNGNGGLELACWYKGFHYALYFGGTDITNVELDSGNAGKGDYRTFMLDSHFGYNIINSKNFLITPKVGIKWYRHRMTNYDNERRISMEQYIAERDLDIRFNHLFGFVGLNCTYKFYIPKYYPFPFAIGFYGGYAYKFNSKPWIYSGQNRLTTDRKVDFNNFNFGVCFSFIMD